MTESETGGHVHECDEYEHHGDEPGHITVRTNATSMSITPTKAIRNWQPRSRPQCLLAPARLPGDNGGNEGLGILELVNAVPFLQHFGEDGLQPPRLG